jgi:uncharacterized protein (DUF2461 family)
MIFKVLLDDFDALSDDEIVRLGGCVIYAGRDDVRVVGLTTRQAHEQLARVRRFLDENGDTWHPVEDAARDVVCSLGPEDVRRVPRSHLRLVSSVEVRT